ncbi:DUF3077 domain-containing protein [Pseudomonas orientalis]|uniref:DUF3077 domain-containing protein n=1 Tax=Pseudomonas orientalis TaxID=76758 RepID=UPI0015E7AEF5|nr:DUF3077 domain-containing protein [Pseudomonas orientalis]MBA1429233.1 DUF3077 domain-containing protein [Pseudomonas orientalis]
MTHSNTLGRSEFSLANGNDQNLLRVNAGIPLEDALGAVSQILHHANQLILDAAISDAGERFSWSSFYLGEMDKALIDDVNEALLESRTAP